MSSAVIWTPLQTPITVLEGNQRPNTTLPSFNVKPGHFSSEAPYAIRTTVPKPNGALVDVEGISKTDKKYHNECENQNGDEGDNLKSFEEILAEVRLSHNNTEYRGPSSADKIFDIFAEYEEEFGKSPTTRDTQKPHPKFADERHRKPAAGSTAVTEKKRKKTERSRDSLLTQNHRPKKRRRSPTFNGGGSVKRSRSSRPAASSVGRGPPPVNDNNQYAVECLLERRNRGRVIEYLVKWQGYGEADNTWVKEADIHPSLIEDFASTAV